MESGSTSKVVAKLPVNWPWVAVDMDGTLCQDNHYPNFGPPRPGAKEAMQKLRSLGVKIMVFTARTAMLGLDSQYQDVNRVVDEIRAWSKEHDIPIDYVFPLPKPTHVLCFFDDRAIPVVNPPDPCRDHAYYWEDAMEVFQRRFGHKLKDWQREITPTTFEVANGA